MKKVSVIITTYKRSVEIVERAIVSVLKQTYSNLEVILVDDNIDKKYIQNNQNLVDKIVLTDNRIKYYINKSNHGACSCRNYGASKSNGEILAFLDDDDEFVHEKLSKMVPYLNKENEFVYSNYSVFRNSSFVRNNSQNVYDSLENLLSVNYIGGCSVPVFTKRLFEEVKGFDESFKSCQDLDLWIRMFLKTKFQYVDEALVNYYIMDESITRSYEKRILGWTRLLDKYSEYYSIYHRSEDAMYNRIVMVLIEDKKFTKAMDVFMNRYKNNIVKFLKYFPLIIKSCLKILLTKIRGYN